MSEHLLQSLAWLKMDRAAVLKANHRHLIRFLQVQHLVGVCSGYL